MWGGECYLYVYLVPTEPQDGVRSPGIGSQTTTSHCVGAGNQTLNFWTIFPATPVTILDDDIFTYTNSVFIFLFWSELAKTIHWYCFPRCAPCHPLSNPKVPSLLLSHWNSLKHWTFSLNYWLRRDRTVGPLCRSAPYLKQPQEEAVTQQCSKERENARIRWEELDRGQDNPKHGNVESLVEI